eukprot:6694104-Prorocentrum_lima.AAC.1
MEPYHAQYSVNSVPNSNIFSLNINTSLTRVKSLFITFWINNVTAAEAAAAPAGTQFQTPAAQ